MGALDADSEDEKPRARAGYLPEIDGLRAVAVLAVVAFHGGLPYAKGGFLGVSLFFTLSGFLITRLLIEERQRQGRVALVTIVAVALLAPHLADATQRNALRGDAVGALAYGANWRFLTHGREYADLFGGPSPLLHFWSLAIEEQFYVVFPLLVAGVFWARRGSRRALGWTLGVLLAGSVALQFLLGDPNRVYLGTDTRAAELLAGALLAVVLHGREISGAGRRFAEVGSVVALAIFGTLLATATVDGAWLTRGGLAGVALVNVTLVAGAVIGVRVFRPLAWRPIVAIGAVSYGIYLFHWPVIVFVSENNTSLRGVQLALVRLAIVAVLAVVSYHFLESPIRYRRALVTRPRLVGVFAVTVVVAAFASALVAAQPGPKLVDPSVLQVAAARPAAAPIVRPKPLRVMVVGDETGQPFAAALARHQNRFVVDDATRSGCPIVRSEWTRRYDGDAVRDTRSCSGNLGNWLQRAKRSKPQLILVMNGAQDAADHANTTPTHWENAPLVSLVDGTAPQLQLFGAALRSTGAAVAWADVARFTIASDPAARARAYFDTRVDVLNNAITRVSVATPGLTTVDFAAHVDGPLGAIDLRTRPGGTIFSTGAARAATRTWFANEVVESYRQARAELGKPVAIGPDPGPDAVRVLVAGDSTSLNITAGLMEYGREHGTLVVEWAGKIGCPVITAAQHRMVGEGSIFTDACTPFAEMWAQRGRAFKPDVVLVMTAFADASDFRASPGDRWRHLGEPEHDAFVATEFDAIADVVGKGVRIAWATAPFEEGHEPHDTPTINARLQVLNDQIHALGQRRANVTVVPFGEKVGSPVVDRAQRPDGIHFTVAAGRDIADRWLARRLVQLGRQRV
ncbi:MAG TPA: acyltransferase family protein [Acidimicrobiia bacterium]|nr:acyltransferase family protein [Acidimicrobiia bacterium]